MGGLWGDDPPNTKDHEFVDFHPLLPRGKTILQGKRPNHPLSLLDPNRLGSGSWTVKLTAFKHRPPKQDFSGMLFAPEFH